MQFLIIFITSFIFSELVFVFSKNFSLELIIEDLTRFLGIEEVFFIHSYISMFIAILNIFLFAMFNKFRKDSNNTYYFLTTYLLINIISVLIIYYFFRVYTVSRIYLILNLLFFPIILYFLLNIDSKFIILKNSVLIILMVASIWIVYSSFQNEYTQLIEEASEKPKNKKPDNYYPNLEMELIIGETNVYEIFPSMDKILLDFENFKSEIKTIINYEEKYELKVFSLCCYWLQYERSGGKSLGYLENYNENLIYVHGSGFVAYVNKNNLIDGNFNFTVIESNFEQIVNNKYIFQRDENFKYGWPDWWESVRDVIIINDRIYISFVNEKHENCVNVEVVSAEFNYVYLDFEYFFTSDECVMRTDFPYYNGMVAGGKLVNFNNIEIFLSTGDFRNWYKSQDDDSYLGKVISINIEDLTTKIISKGHRNPQGLALTKNKSFLIETEHGAVGGDEINLIEIGKSENFGWPISSYSEHWYKDDYDAKNGIATLYKSHSDYGMKEPLFYQYVGFFGGIGISDVEINHFKNLDSFFVTTLNGRQIFDIDVDIVENKMTYFKRYKVPERIRDIEFDPDNNVYFLILEDGPSIGVFTQYNN